MADSSGWSLDRRVGSASQLCRPWPAGEQLRRRVATCHVTRRALVLGSAQGNETVDAELCASRGVEIVRRPAGGGAVLVAPAQQVWMDFWLPRGDELWDDDIVSSARWTGEVWARALGSLGLSELDVHRGPSVETHWSRLVCFAGLGPGEVTVDRVKFVGIAQRRTREGARFLTVAPLAWAPAEVVELLSLDVEQRARAVVELASVARGLSKALAGSGSHGGSSVVEVVEREVIDSLP